MARFYCNFGTRQENRAENQNPAQSSQMSNSSKTGRDMFSNVLLLLTMNAHTNLTITRYRFFASDYDHNLLYFKINLNYLYIILSGNSGGV